MKSQIYKDTELGRLPKEWEVAKFADNFEYAKGKKPNEVADERKSNFLPYLSTEYLRENILTKFANFSEGVEVVADGELILLWDGSNAGEIFYGKKGVLSSTMVKIKQKTDKFQTNFLFYLLKSKQDYLQSQTKGTGIPHVSGNVLDNLLLPLPPLSEQQKISEILSTVDSAIQKTDEILAKTERLKKGAMQKLLAKGIGHKEFKDTEIGRLPKEWEVVKLGKISELKNGINFSKIQKAEGGLPTIDVLNMYGNSIYADLSSLYSVQINLESNSDFVLKNGDILFVRSSMKREGAGWACLFKENEKRVTFCGFIIRARLTTNKIIPEFITYFLRSPKARKIIIANAGQVGIANINQNALSNLNVPLPPLPEQQKIAEILSTIDGKLEQERRRKEKLERVKKGLMNELLTGRKRVS